MPGKEMNILLYKNIETEIKEKKIERTNKKTVIIILKNKKHLTTTFKKYLKQIFNRIVFVFQIDFF